MSLQKLFPMCMCVCVCGSICTLHCAAVIGRCVELTHNQSIKKKVFLFTKRF